MNLGIKLLVAEDDPNMGTILKAYLTQKGYTVFLATDGQQALDLYKECNVDACILDVMMPVKDGFAVAKELRRIDKNIFMGSAVNMVESFNCNGRCSTAVVCIFNFQN